MNYLAKYGQAKTINFVLIDKDETDFESTPVTFASGDTQISKDEGAYANTTNNPSHEGNGHYSLSLTATEMQAARIVITIIDQTATKEWEDQCIIIETYGNASAEHAFDLDTANITQPTEYPMSKNTAFSNFCFVMINSSDDISPATGLTVTAERSIDGGAFAACANSVSEVSNGVYKIDLAAADLNGNCIVLKFTATGANPTLHTLILPD